MSDYIPPYLCLPNYERPELVPQPKGIPHRLVTDAAKAKVNTRDKKERAKCHERSHGQCEVYEVIAWRGEGTERTPAIAERCLRRVAENHHLLGGIGRRNRGRSILAEHRLDVCLKCHADITGNVLVPIDGTKKHLAEEVRYERIVMPKEIAR